MNIFKSIGRIGKKAWGSVKRVGNKVADGLDSALRVGGKVALKVGHVAGQVGQVASFVGKYGKMAAPFLGAIPGVGMPLAGGITAVAGGLQAVGGGLQQVGKFSDKVSSNIQRGQRIVRAGRQALNDPSTTMANLRTIEREGGAAAKSLKGAYSQARSLGNR